MVNHGTDFIFPAGCRYRDERIGYADHTTSGLLRFASSDVL
jgi:hypothetical protein